MWLSFNREFKIVESYVGPMSTLWVFAQACLDRVVRGDCPPEKPFLLDRTHLEITDVECAKLVAGKSEPPSKGK